MLYLFTDRSRKYINVPHFLMYSLSGEIDFKKYSSRATRSQSSPSWRNSSLLQPEVSSRSCLAITNIAFFSPTIVLCLIACKGSLSSQVKDDQQRNSNSRQLAEYREQVLGQMEEQNTRKVRKVHSPFHSFSLQIRRAKRLSKNLKTNLNS